MDKDEAGREIARLRDEIARHDDLYYRQAMPEIEDRDYDALLRRLQDLEAGFPEFATSDSPTARVGADSDARFPSLPHSRPMISLQNSYDLDEVAAFVQRVRKELGGRDVLFTVEPKIDGVAVALRYLDGSFEVGLTRGDGESGDVITGNLRTFREIPASLPDDWRRLVGASAEVDGIELRGEAYLGLKRFEALNLEREAAGRDPLANPRNATAGTLKTLDPRVVAGRGLSLFCYQLLPLSGTLDLRSHRDEMTAIAALGLPVNPFLRTGGEAEELSAHLAVLADQRGGMDYQIDGAVLKVDDLSLYGRLGATARAPRWGLAYKYAAEEAETRLESVTLQVGRTGVITPVAELAPVNLAGTRVARATLHNWEEIERKDIRIRDRVVIAKGGDIIPKVLRVDVAARGDDVAVIARPEACPVCGSAIEDRVGEVALRCGNPRCPARLAGRLRHFAGRDACDVDGLGTRGVDQLLEAGLVEDLPDLFNLSREALIALPGWAEKSADALLRALAAAGDRPWEAKLFALGLTGVGLGTARILAGRFPGIRHLLAADHETLEALEDIGPEIAGTIVKYSEDSGFMDMIEKLAEAGFLKDPERDPAESEPEAIPDGWFTGKRFVLTGSLDACDRRTAKSLIERAGGKVVSAISGKTDALIAGRDPGSKREKAEALGVAILDEAAFLGRLEEAGLALD